MMLLARKPTKGNLLLERCLEAWSASSMAPLCRWCTAMHPVFAKFGQLGYIGESANRTFLCIYHVIRILRPEGSAQQPFPEVIGRGAVSTNNRLRAAVRGRLFGPVHWPARTQLLEKLWRGSTPYSQLLACMPSLTDLHETCTNRRCDQDKIFGTARPVKEPSGKTQTVKISSQAGLLEAGSKTIVAACPGHKKPLWLFGWNLSPSPWVYVVYRGTDHEEGWRRKGGLSIEKCAGTSQCVQCCIV